MSQDIGSKVKEMRTRKKLTLKDVSDMTGLSTGFLSQLERGLTNIATDSLVKIAEALDVEATYFFGQGITHRKYILRSYEKEVAQIVNSRFIHYHLTNDFPHKHLLPRLIEMLPLNTQEDITPYAHDGEEFIYVLEGVLTLSINNEQVELFPGDSAHYPSSIIHNWANYTSKMVRLLVISVPTESSGR